ncbi:MAG: HipA domain-containing protein [Sulfurospirillaceae bacterium]|nr:HipA domain-containing protein [Sulfurospirillaceae bacterium]
MNNFLYIFYREQVVGRLEIDDAEDLSLTYSNDWKQNGFSISPALPLSGDFVAKDVKNFIVNLLPEGKGLEKLSELCQISKSNHFGLLRAIGRETSGALSFGAENAIETTFRKVTQEELTERILDRKNTPIVIWDKKVRLSLSGVQEKLPITMIDGEFGFGEGNLASTHILKFGNNDNLVWNEFLSLELAKVAGLTVNKTEIRYFDDEPVLFIERFDREIIEFGKRVNKLHLIDGCQLLSMPPSYKYERNFGNRRDVQDIRQGVSFQKLFRAQNRMAIPALYIQSLITWKLVNLCLGNSDAHGKNISFFISKSGSLQTAPFYDIANITLYEEYDHDLAMAVGDQFEMMKISAYDLALHCSNTNIQENLLISVFNTIYKKIFKHIDSKKLYSLRGVNIPFVEDFTNNVVARMEYLKKSINELKRSDFGGYF